MYSYEADKQEILTRLRRMEGQLRGIQRMVEENKYCVDVLTQLSSIIAAAHRVGEIVLQDHIQGCVKNALSQDENSETAIQELMEAIRRFGRA